MHTNTHAEGRTHCCAGVVGRDRCDTAIPSRCFISDRLMDARRRYRSIGGRGRMRGRYGCLFRVFACLAPRDQRSLARVHRGRKDRVRWSSSTFHLSFSFSLSLSLFLSLSLSLSLFIYLFLNHSLSVFLYLPLSFILLLFLSLSLSLFFSLSSSLSLARSLAHSLTRSLAHSLTHSLTHSATRIHAHTHSWTNACERDLWKPSSHVSLDQGNCFAAQLDELWQMLCHRNSRLLFIPFHYSFYKKNR